MTSIVNRAYAGANPVSHPNLARLVKMYITFLYERKVLS